jgi:hypothetical protein
LFIKGLVNDTQPTKKWKKLAMVSKELMDSIKMLDFDDGYDR